MDIHKSIEILLTWIISRRIFSYSNMLNDLLFSVIHIEKARK